MAPSLATLPPELLEAIADLCRPNDDRKTLLHLRQANRDIQAATRKTWLDEYFQCRIVRLERTKLIELDAISDEDDLAAAVTSLEVQCVDDTTLHKIDGTTYFAIPTLPKFVATFQGAFVRAIRPLRNVNLIEFTYVPHYGGKKVDSTTDYAKGVDISGTVGEILRAVEATEIRPNTIVVNHRNGEQVQVGMSDCEVLSQMEQCFRNLYDLQLCFHLRPEVIGGQAPNVAKLGSQLNGSFERLETLASLDLTFSWLPHCIDLFSRLAGAVHLPRLQYLGIQSADLRLGDLCYLLERHVDTLKRLYLGFLWVVPGVDEVTFGAVLKMLAARFDLATLQCDSILACRGRPIFPGMGEVVASDSSNEDGYIEVQVESDVVWLGPGKVDEGLRQMMECMVWREY